MNSEVILAIVQFKVIFLNLLNQLIRQELVKSVLVEEEGLQNRLIFIFHLMQFYYYLKIQHWLDHLLLSQAINVRQLSLADQGSNILAFLITSQLLKLYLLYLVSLSLLLYQLLTKYWSVGFVTHWPNYWFNFLPFFNSIDYKNHNFKFFS